MAFNIIHGDSDNSSPGRVVEPPNKFTISDYCFNMSENPKLYGKLKTAINGIPVKNRNVILNAKDSQGLTPLIFAVVGKSVKAVELLLKEGALVNVADAYGYTPLLYSAGQFGNLEMTRLFLDKKADVNYCQNALRHSPMFVASQWGNYEILKLLFRSGADPRIPDIEGDVALNVAKKQDCKKLLTDIIRTLDLKLEKKGAVCETCKIAPEKLRRCGDCRATFYCSKECQKEDWKARHKYSCKGFIVAHEKVPGRLNQNRGHMITFDFANMLQAGKPTIKKSQRAPISKTNEEFRRKVAHHIGNPFIVKVQVELGPSPCKSMGVYCEDRCCHYWIEKDDPLHHQVDSFIRREGVGHYKAYYWAEIHDTVEKAIKIYYGKVAPTQPW